MARRAPSRRRPTTAKSLFSQAMSGGAHAPRPLLPHHADHRTPALAMRPVIVPARVGLSCRTAANPVPAPADGYLRITWRCLCEARFAHLFSGVDPEQTPHLSDSISAICGYTEWVSCVEPLISLGWDWWLNTETGLLERVESPVRSNLMLVGQDCTDLGCRATEDLLGQRLEALEWQAAVACAVGLRQ